MAKLYVNVDHVATVREARKTNEPDPVAAALAAELAGADGITVHLREDRRHIQDRDLRILREVVTTKLNMEMAAVEEMVEIALEVKPDEATLVPEKRQEITTEGGLDVAGNAEHVAKVVQRLRQGGILVSLFIDPDPAQVRVSKEVGAEAVEVNTGAYSEAKTDAEVEVEFKKISQSVVLAFQSGLKVHAGHGLTYKNVGLVAKLKEIEEFNIGHNIIARAVMVGMERAVREMYELVRG